MDTACIFQDGEEDQFFDSREEMLSLSDSYPNSLSSCSLNPEEGSCDCVHVDAQYKVWVSNPGSVQERRANFMRWMGLDPIHLQSPEEESVDVHIERFNSNGRAILRSSDLEDSSSMPSMPKYGSSEESFEIRIKNLDDGSVFVVDEFSADGSLKSLREVSTNRSITPDEFNRSFGPSSSVRKLMQREDSKSGNTDKVVSRRRNGWLKKLGAVSCIVDRKWEEIDSSVSDSDESVGSAQRIKVHSTKKRLKEFSAVYKGQDIKAHDGAVVTMKFSPNGKFLASGGEDGIVRVWQVIECERTEDEGDIPERDPSCIFFKVNHSSELAPLYIEKEKLKSQGMKKTSDSACVVVPPEVFRISEEPLNEFHGHDGDVLDLSWSNDKYLLSSSVDKTVRLWKVSCDSCLKVFSHNNYVTCVQFNPVNENYFVSGSIDGKVRIWEIKEQCVVDWTDIRDIVTALSYNLNGKAIVVGTMTGDCRFYDASDNQLQLEAQVPLQSKKKSSEKRITGFQYCPSNPRKLMVTSADSQIRILDGVDVVSRYKGLRNGGSQISASFTSDGRHIISASEDSNVYVWSHEDHNSPTPNHVKTTWSSEKFFSSHVSVAIPWLRPVPTNPLFEFPQENNNTIYLSPAGSFTLGHEFFSEFLPKGSATWPEEKLPLSSTVITSSLCKSQYKFLKSSFRNSSHAWGQVIVTAGWDGRIRSFRNYGLPVNQ